MAFFSWFRSNARLSHAQIVRAVRAAFESDRLTLSSRRRLKENLIDSITRSAAEQASAEKLESLLVAKSSARGELASLARLAREIGQLAAVRPRVEFRERLFARIVQPSHASWGLLRSALTSLVLFAFVGTVSLGSFVWQTRPAVAEAGTLEINAGTVQVRPSQGQFFVAVADQATVRVGDTVRVGPDAEVTLKLKKSGEVTLNPGSEIQFVPADSPAESPALAVIDGEVATSSDSVVEIVTPNGRAVATGEVRVRVTADAASTEIEPEPAAQVAVQPNNSEAEPTPVEPGMVAVLEGEQVTIAAAAPANPAEQPAATEPDPAVVAAAQAAAAAKIAAELADFSAKSDIASIRLFDALALAQAGQIEQARTILAQVRDQITQLTTQHAGGVVINRFAALQVAAESEYAGLDGQAELLQRLQLAAAAESVLNYYLLSDERLELPAVQAAEAAKYTPSPELKQLFVALRAREIAQASAEESVETLTRLTLQKYAAEWNQFDAAKVTQFVSGMGNQQIFAPALRQLRVQVGPQIRFVLDRKLAELDAAANPPKLDAVDSAESVSGILAEPAEVEAQAIQISRPFAD